MHALERLTAKISPLGSPGHSPLRNHDKSPPRNRKAQLSIMKKESACRINACDAWWEACFQAHWRRHIIRKAAAAAAAAGLWQVSYDQTSRIFRSALSYKSTGLFAPIAHHDTVKLLMELLITFVSITVATRNVINPKTCLS